MSFVKFVEKIFLLSGWKDIKETVCIFTRRGEKDARENNFFLFWAGHDQKWFKESKKKLSLNF